MGDFLKWLAEVVGVGGTSAVITYGLFRWLGQKWIEHKLNTQLESYKAEQQKELERLRQFLSGRISKIHKKEFEILPRAWFMLHEACGSAYYALVGPKWYPEFGETYTEPEIEEILTQNEFTDIQKEGLRSASDRSGYFLKVMLVKELNDASRKRQTFHNYLIEHRLFMTDELREKFGAVDGDLTLALSEYSIGKNAKNLSMQRAAIEKISSLKAKIDEVEQAVQKRLHYEEA